MFLDIHTHQAIPHADTLCIRSISAGHDSIAFNTEEFVSIGLHPWYSSLNDLPKHLAILESEADKSHVKLIGECGLDKLKGDSLPQQIQILERQIALAERLQKPLILHCVKAFAELIAIKDRLNVKVPMIIHGFDKHEALGKQLLQKGFFLSFGVAILKENSGAAKLVSTLDNFFLETDDAQISIKEIYTQVAILKKCSVDELKACIFANWKKINLI
ncbi:TatD family hydrolase [Pedobacter sp. MW01-1-1]|uniref:TatD family hydrolase n=1 Tax=Pedobacter sp. MW01-1-1 TaxID=3383027 RepID=UPI003FEE0426